jgi:hypothetical protein
VSVTGVVEFLLLRNERLLIGPKSDPPKALRTPQLAQQIISLLKAAKTSTPGSNPDSASNLN